MCRTCTQPSQGALTIRSGKHAASVAISWRLGRGGALAWYALIFIGVLLYLAAGAGQFRTVHRMIMLMASVAMAYFVLAHLLNATQLAVGGGELRVTHGPLPWFGRVSMPLQDVRKLSFDEHTSRLQLKTRLGEEVTLLDGLRADRLTGLNGALENALKREEPSKP